MLLKEVNLQLGEPVPVVQFHAQDAASGTDILNAILNVHWTDDENMFLRSNIPDTGLTLLIPKHPTLLTISAPGYQDWRWQNPGNAELLQQQKQNPGKPTIEQALATQIPYAPK